MWAVFVAVSIQYSALLLYYFLTGTFSFMFHLDIHMEIPGRFKSEMNRYILYTPLMGIKA
jgi:hypothetical protein